MCVSSNDNRDVQVTIIDDKNGRLEGNLGREAAVNTKRTQLIGVHSINSWMHGLDHGTSFFSGNDLKSGDTNILMNKRVLVVSSLGKTKILVSQMNQLPCQLTESRWLKSTIQDLQWYGCA